MEHNEDSMYINLFKLYVKRQGGGDSGEERCGGREGGVGFSPMQLTQAEFRADN
jgi:hypothetical protein